MPPLPHTLILYLKQEEWPILVQLIYQIHYIGGNIVDQYTIQYNIQNNILYEDKLQHNNNTNIFFEGKKPNNQNNIL